jgi:hypothetical protein
MSNKIRKKTNKGAVKRQIFNNLGCAQRAAAQLTLERKPIKEQLKDRYLTTWNVRAARCCTAYLRSPVEVLHSTSLSCDPSPHSALHCTNRKTDWEKESQEQEHGEKVYNGL